MKIGEGDAKKSDESKWEKSGQRQGIKGERSEREGLRSNSREASFENKYNVEGRVMEVKQRESLIKRAQLEKGKTGVKA